MIARFTSSLPKQCAVLAVFTMLAGLACWFFDFHPRVKFGPEYFFRGFVGGSIVAAVSLALHWTAVFFFPKQLSVTRKITEEYRLEAPLQLSTRTIAAAAGEELLLRAFIFHYLAAFSFALGMLVNFLLSFGLYYEGRDRLINAAIKGVECSFYAVMYWESRSLFMIVTARFAAEILISQLLSNRSLFTKCENAIFGLRGPVRR